MAACQRGTGAIRIMAKARGHNKHWRMPVALEPHHDTPCHEQLE